MARSRSKANSIWGFAAVPVFAVLISGTAWFTQQPVSPEHSRLEILPDTRGFATASPMVVFATSRLVGGHKETFEFGKPYEIFARTSSHVGIRLESGRRVYVHPRQVNVVRSPRWLVTTSAYNTAGRETLRFWKEPAKLKDFLSGNKMTQSRWDYEEYFDTAPTFQLKLPILGADTVPLLKGDRPVQMVSVMLPITDAVVQAFSIARSRFDKKIALYFVIDVSGSTKGFLDGTMAALARTLDRHGTLRSRVENIVLTTFGISRSEKSKFIGKVEPRDLETFAWRQSTANQKTVGEREPLVDGLVALGRGKNSAGDSIPVLVVISGADVELVRHGRRRGGSIAIGEIDLNLSAGASAVFAQITPEPGDELRTASQQLAGVSHVHYVEYSDVLADEIAANLMRIADNQDTEALAAESLRAVAKAAHANQTMAFLPRVLTSTAELPRRKDDAGKADWYSASLWLAVDRLLWTETTD